MKGKNFSLNNCGQRRKNDFYETPYSLTWQLIETGELNDCNTFLEPACGNGAITKMLVHHFGASLNIIQYDLFFNNIDFFNEKKKYDCVVTNPPFSKANEFVLHAKKVAKKKIIFLLPLSYLHGQYRFEKIYSDIDFRLKCVYVFTRYPLLGEPLREDGKYNTGMQVYAWFVWDKECKDEPVIRHIDNNKYVLKKGE